MTLRIVLVADGDTDYDFMEKAKAEDERLSGLPVELVKPEDIGLRRRSGGGHKTLLREAGLATIMAAKGYADGVLVLVDNDGDPRFSFPHDSRCRNCRECEARSEIERIDWGRPIRRNAAIVYQAIETLLLSATGSFTPQMEASLVGEHLKTALYGVRIESARERYDAFRSALEGTEVHAIRARSYPRIQGKLRELSGRG
jgi:hypothetical protein